jgi:hypothetical protein
LGYADNAVEAGIFAVWERLVSGRLKVFKSLTAWFNEYRIYRRDENGKVAADQDDHIMDCTRYLILSGMRLGAVMPYNEDEDWYEDQEANKTKGKTGGYFGLY